MISPSISNLSREQRSNSVKTEWINGSNQQHLWKGRAHSLQNPRRCLMSEGQLRACTRHSSPIIRLTPAAPFIGGQPEQCCNWVLHHDNKPAHSTLKTITLFLAPPAELTRFGSLHLHCFSENEIQAEVFRFWHRGGDPAHFTDGAWRVFRLGPPETVPSVAEALEQKGLVARFKFGTVFIHYRWTVTNIHQSLATGVNDKHTHDIHKLINLRFFSKNIFRGFSPPSTFLWRI